MALQHQLAVPSNNQAYLNSHSHISLRLNDKQISPIFQCSHLDVTAGSALLPPPLIEDTLLPQSCRQDMLSSFPSQVTQLQHQENRDVRNFLDTRFSMSCNARYDLHSQATMPQRLSVEPALNIVGSTTSRLALESRMPVMLQHCVNQNFEPGMNFDDHGVLTDQVLVGKRRRSPQSHILPPPPSFPVSEHKSQVRHLLPGPQSSPIRSNPSALFHLQESQTIVTNSILQNTNAIHSHTDGSHLASFSSNDSTSIRECSNMEESDKASISPPYSDKQQISSLTSKAITISDDRAINLSLSEPASAWSNAVGFNDSKNLGRRAYEGSNSIDVNRPTSLLAGSPLDSALDSDPGNNFISGSSILDERHVIPQKIQATDRLVNLHSGSFPILSQNHQQDLLPTITSPATLPFSTASYLTSSPAFLYPTMFSSSPAVPTQLLLPAEDKTYEVLGGPGTSRAVGGNSPILHTPILVSSTRDCNLQKGKMVHYGHLENSNEKAFPLSSNDQSRSSTDAKYFKRRLSISRDFAEKGVESLPSSKNHLLLISNEDISKEEGKVKDVSILDSCPGSKGKSSHSLMDDSAISYTEHHFSHSLHRFEKSAPLLSSSTKFGLDRKYSDPELAERPAKSHVILYPKTPSASSASAQGGRSDSKSPVSRRVSEEQSDHGTVWRPY